MRAKWPETVLPLVGARTLAHAALPLDAVACVARELRDAKSRGDDILTTLDNLKPKRAR